MLTIEQYKTHRYNDCGLLFKMSCVVDKLSAVKRQAVINVYIFMKLHSTSVSY